MRLFLIGFMGCGKSTFGKKLAKAAGYAYTDLDKTIEKKTGSSVAAIFREKGEAAFRELERETLRETGTGNNTVIATGGGTPCFFDNLQWMKNNGTVIYLFMEPAALASRLLPGKEKRPLLQDIPDQELVGFITQKLAEREQWYQQAHLIFPAIGLQASEVINKVLFTAEPGKPA